MCLRIARACPGDTDYAFLIFAESCLLSIHNRAFLDETTDTRSIS